MLKDQKEINENVSYIKKKKMIGYKSFWRRRVRSWVKERVSKKSEFK